MSLDRPDVVVHLRTSRGQLLCGARVGEAAVELDDVTCPLCLSEV